MKFSVTRKKPIPFEFVLDLLERAGPVVKPMFGFYAVYLGEKIVMVLSDKPGAAGDNGIWIATAPEHHESLKQEFPEMRSLVQFGPGPTGWQNLPADGDDFEDSAHRLCRLLIKGDPRIGKVPQRKRKLKKTKPAAKPKKRAAPASKAARRARPRR